MQLDHSYHRVLNEKNPICILAHNIEIPMNVGSVFRIADAFGVEKIYLSGNTPKPPNKKIKKTSRSTENFVEYEYVEDPHVLIERLKQNGYTILSLELCSDSIELEKLSLSDNKKICLILGSESTGVSKILLDESDKIVFIPMLGQNSSMNVANACAIAVYSIVQKLQ